MTGIPKAWREGRAFFSQSSVSISWEVEKLLREAPVGYKRVVSVSLGPSSRNKTVQAELGGTPFWICRVGTDGDFGRFQQWLYHLDGKVDALGLGGVDLYIHCGGWRYTFRQIAQVAQKIRHTPVVDGSGLKNSWEREVITYLAEEKIVLFKGKKAFISSAVDRFGMAEALDQAGCSLAIGDLMFGLGIPVALRSLTAVNILGRMILPVIVRLPFQWLYPTGEKGDKIVPKFTHWYRWADILAGDFPYLRRHLPPPEGKPLAGKVMITNTVTDKDVEELRRRGLSLLITTTPEMEGRSFGTNVIEGIIVALSGKSPGEMTPKDYLEAIRQLRLKPRIQTL